MRKKGLDTSVDDNINAKEPLIQLPQQDWLTKFGLTFNYSVGAQVTEESVRSNPHLSPSKQTKRWTSKRAQGEACIISNISCHFSFATCGCVCDHNIKCIRLMGFCDSLMLQITKGWRSSQTRGVIIECQLSAQFSHPCGCLTFWSVREEHSKNWKNPWSA